MTVENASNVDKADGDMRKSLRSNMKRKLLGQSFLEHHDEPSVSAAATGADASIAVMSRAPTTDFNQTMRTATSRGSIRSSKTDIFTQVETQSQLAQVLKQSNQQDKPAKST